MIDDLALLLDGATAIAERTSADEDLVRLLKLASLSAFAVTQGEKGLREARERVLGLVAEGRSLNADERAELDRSIEAKLDKLT